ncbi:50S ribosomal protein L11 methyltransferase [uncultured Phascolarctobacterium sp.]|uniref:50S ribosomal protein L11 methyltransferase n=1 Tax=uncultured Phascolarctobacterium sp. TaxID=512296 RepID=UPI0025DBD0B7|nr:50S ribosomal protein L11 methyltransferase [uncultured Phascolarctobacterium sp.]
MSQWIEVSIQTTHEAAELTAEIMRAAGANNGVVIEDPVLINTLRNSGTWELCDIPEQGNTEVVTVTAYYPEDEELQPRLAQIEEEMAALEASIGTCRFGNTRFRTVSEQDWANEWKQYFHVTHIGETLVIKPTWEEYAAKAGEHIIEIDPGMAFGTGTHHTTCMCMERLEKVLRPGMEVFDVGTGSGILAIAAAKLGAETVKAVDIDATAVRVAAENIAANGLTEKINVKQGDLLQGTEGQADVIIANIIADIIIMLLEDVPGKLKNGGIFLASGIIEERQNDVAAAAAKAGLCVEAVDTKGGWVVMQMRKEA